MSKQHPGFKKAAASIARKQHVPMKEARAELAASTRGAFTSAKRANPRLRKVK